MPAMAIAAVVGGAAVAVAGAVAVMAVAVVMFVIGGVANGVITVSMRSIIVHRVPDRFRGRVFAAYGGLFFGTQLAAMAVAGGLVVALSGRLVLIIGGVGTVLAGVGGLLAYRSLSAAERRDAGRSHDRRRRCPIRPTRPNLWRRRPSPCRPSPWSTISWFPTRSWLTRSRR